MKGFTIVFVLAVAIVFFFTYTGYKVISKELPACPDRDWARLCMNK